MREFCFCSCLPFLPGFECKIHATWGPPFRRSLYFIRISGLQLEALAYELSGTLVRDISYPGAVFRDGRLRRGDLVLFLNHECLWRVTSSQAKIILRRADFVTNGIP